MIPIIFIKNIMIPNGEYIFVIGLRCSTFAMTSLGICKNTKLLGVILFYMCMSAIILFLKEELLNILLFMTLIAFIAYISSVKKIRIS
jgi:hypothetical protein